MKKKLLSNPVTRWVYKQLSALSFSNSRDYWENRYQRGLTSGIGSYGKLAEFKANTLNQFVHEQHIHSVIEFGCGDGNQLSMADYPSYIGLDVSRTVLKLCLSRFSGDDTKSFFLYDSEAYVDCHDLFKAELALSIDVIYHLVEDDVFEQYMSHLFKSAE